MSLPRWLEVLYRTPHGARFLSLLRTLASCITNIVLYIGFLFLAYLPFHFFGVLVERSVGAAILFGLLVVFVGGHFMGREEPRRRSWTDNLPFWVDPAVMHWENIKRELGLVEKWEVSNECEVTLPDPDRATHERDAESTGTDADREV